MTAAEKINFVNVNQSAEYFEKDAELYRKIYPNSRLLPELSRANQYNKQHLDGRMLLEILDVVCSETVMENRGIVNDAALPLDLTTIDLDKTNYQERKNLIKALSLKTDNQRSESLLMVLKAKKEELIAANAKPAENTDEAPDAQGKEDTPAASAGNAEPEKKSGDPE